MWRALIAPWWLILCAAAAAVISEFLVVVMLAEYPASLPDGARFMPYVAFSIILAAWAAYSLGSAIWYRFVPWVPESELDRLPICKVCGYDIRASTDRCPECGTPILAAKP